jgi:hypothetical protein
MDIKEYRPSTKTIKAVRLGPYDENEWAEIAEWCGGVLFKDDEENRYIEVSAERRLTAKEGEWIVRDRYWQCKVYNDFEFKNRYEEA